jgi:hypothetical protein
VTGGVGVAGTSVANVDAAAVGGSDIRARVGVGIDVGTAVGGGVREGEGVGLGVCMGVGEAVCDGVGAASGWIEAESGNAALGAGLLDGRGDGDGATAVTQAVASKLAASSIAPAATDRGPIVMPIAGPSQLMRVDFPNQYTIASVPALGRGWVLRALWVALLPSESRMGISKSITGHRAVRAGEW